MNAPVLQISPRDNVAVSLRNLEAGTTVTVGDRTVRLEAAVPRSHKFALRRIAAREPVVKFGQPIGCATTEISSGAWVHGQNLQTAAVPGVECTYEPVGETLPAVDDSRVFLGYRRPNGEVGIRNEIWIVPTVGCVNEIAHALARQINARALPGNVGGVFALPHPHGCSQLGDDHTQTQRLLAALAQHPNAAGVLVVGLGCENNSMASFRKLIPQSESPRYQFMVAQEAGDELAAGRRKLDALIEYAASFHRERVPLGELRIGLKCGGSDALSDLMANPLVGAVTDQLVARGGSAVLTDVPEVFGAEGRFMQRCASREVFDACAAMLRDYKAYLQRYAQPVYEAVGQRDGGVTTLEERALGCLQKGGTSPLVDILPYGGRIRRAGLSFLSGPGNDIVAVTALAAAGVHAVLFTTGRGTPLGGPVPTLKIAAHPDVTARKPNWIDFDAADLLAGKSIADTGSALFDLLIETANGQPARNELNGFREIAIFKDGVTL
jgi:altronate hydrolase